MNKLKFKLITNDEEIIDEEVNYFEKDNIINFKIADDIYQLDKEKIILIKKDQEKELTMNFKEKLIIINLYTNNIKIDYSIDNCKINKEKNIIKIDYTLESENKIKNSIFIEF